MLPDVQRRYSTHPPSIFPPGYFRMTVRRAAFLLACFILPVQAQEVAPDEVFAASAETGSGVSPEVSPEIRAEIARLKAGGKALRDQAEADYRAAVPGCYERFLVNRCIDQAKQARLEAVQRARQMESEARRLDLAEKQRALAARPADAAAPAQVEPAAPSPDAAIAPAPEADRIRAERAGTARQAEVQAGAERAAADAQRARKRAAAEAEAAGRAEQAARDRARYEERIRQYEEKKARDEAGR